MIYVKEALKFLLLSFFKQCRIILRILEKFHEMHKDREDSRSHHVTKESIVADMLARNLKWAILTILTCITEESDEMMPMHQGPPNEGISVMGDLSCFRPILLALQE